MAVITESKGTFHQEHQGSDVQSKGNDNLKHSSNHLFAAKLTFDCAKLLHKLRNREKNAEKVVKRENVAKM